MYYANTSTQSCEACDSSCSICLYTANFCTSCNLGYYLYNNMCYNQCPDGTFLQADNISCANCSLLCMKCNGSASVCSVCQTVAPYISYLYNRTSPTGTCVSLCPKGTYAENYNGTGPNLCLDCNSSCAACVINAYNCQQCSPGYYLLDSTCYSSCPSGLFPSNASGSGQCLDCNLVCVDLTILMYFTNAVNN
jgi:proprotein convertase subtilisin/kexin type 5